MPTEQGSVAYFVYVSLHFIVVFIWTEFGLLYVGPIHSLHSVSFFFFFFGVFSALILHPSLPRHANAVLRLL